MSYTNQLQLCYLQYKTNNVHQYKINMVEINNLIFLYAAATKTCHFIIYMLYCILI